MNILIVCQHWPLCTGRYLTNAFRKLGHDVKHIGSTKGGETGMSEKRYPQYAWNPQGDWDMYWADWTPDVVLYVETLFPYWRHKHYSDVPHMQYNTAGPMDDVMPDIQHTFTAVSWGGIWDKTDAVTWLPCAVNPAFKPSPIPWHERTWDVALVGRLDSDRMPLLERLNDAGFKVYWDCGPIYDDYVNIYHDARMGLVQTVRRTVPCRVFEMPALGVLGLSPWYPEYEKLGVRGYVYFDDQRPIELPAIVERTLLRYEMDYDRWDKSEKDRQWSQQHTWNQRAQQIMEVLEREYRTSVTQNR